MVLHQWYIISFQYTLPESAGSNYDDYTGQVQHEFEFHPWIVTDSVSIKIISVYGDQYSGFTEIEFFTSATNKSKFILVFLGTWNKSTK